MNAFLKNKNHGGTEHRFKIIMGGFSPLVHGAYVYRYALMQIIFNNFDYYYGMFNINSWLMHDKSLWILVEHLKNKNTSVMNELRARNF